MILSLLSYPLMSEALTKRVTPDILCGICQENRIHSIDLMELELRLYGRKKLKNAMSRNRIRCGCLIANIDFLVFPNRAKHHLEKALGNCELMGCKTLMVVPGYPVDRGLIRLRMLDRSAMMDEAVRFFTLAVEEAKKHGITVGLEDSPQKDKPFCSVSEMKTLLTRVPGLGLILDTGNIFIADPGADLLEYYEELKPWVTRIHLKDVVRRKRPGTEKCVDGLKIIPVATGKGILPMQDFLRKLKTDGYDGALCIEYAPVRGIHGKGHREALTAYAEYIRQAWSGR